MVTAISVLAWGLTAWVPYVGWPYLVLGRRVPDAGPAIVTIVLALLALPAGACFFLAARPARDLIRVASRRMVIGASVAAGALAMGIMLAFLALGAARPVMSTAPATRIAVALLCCYLVPRLVWASARRLTSR